ncbi:MAG TPA: hypothetical protein VLR49_07470 [Ferruginibacter sp.]|nr:hypothetical protein [Ferruginibacter sp.]
MKTLCVYLALFMGTTRNLSAQEILFSKPFRTQNYSTSEVLGKIGKNYIVLERGLVPYGKNILRVFDQQMQLVGDKKQVRLPPNGRNLQFLVYDSFLVKTYVENAGTHFLLIAVIMNGFAQELGSPIILDSMRSDVATFPFPAKWDVVHSLDKSKLLVNRVKYDQDSASISTKIFDDRLQKLQFSDFKIFLPGGREFIGEFKISNGGDIYFPIQPVKAGMNKFEILSKPFKEKYYRSVLIDLKSKYLNTNALTFTIEETKGNGTLLINATYYSNVNSTVDEGFFSARINAETNSSKAIFNPLMDSLFNRSKLSESSNRPALITLNNVFVLNNGGLMLVGEIDRPRFTMVGITCDYLNQTIINPRYIYNPGYADQYYQQQPMYMDPLAYGPKSRVELYNKDIVVCYLDSALKLQRQTVIEKDQNDIKTEMPLYLSFGVVNTSSGIHLLYREIQRSGGILRNTRFSASGEMVRLPPLKTIYDTYKIIPAYSKQVGLRQVIIPGVYRGKTVIAKIDL